MTKSNFTVRPLAQEDKEQWKLLWTAYLTFYETELPEEATDILWSRFHDETEPMFVRGAFEGDSLLGIVQYVFHRATWTTGHYCYLEDLFTAENARQKGVGRALIESVYDAADEFGASRVYWLTHESNVQAQKLYDKIASNAGFIQYRRT